MSGEEERWLETGRLAELGLQSAALVHELRQPVFAIKALAQLMTVRGGELPEGARTQLATLVDQVGLVEQILDRYQGSGRRPGDAAGPVRLGPPVLAAVATLAHHARAEGISLELDGDVADGVVLGDEVALRQITTNLVQNAVDAADTMVRVRIDDHSVQVYDDGPGIPEDVREHLFERFFTTKPLGKGTGLGLAVAKSLVDGAGGALTFETGADGTTFTVTLQSAELGEDAGEGRAEAG